MEKKTAKHLSNNKDDLLRQGGEKGRVEHLCRLASGAPRDAAQGDEARALGATLTLDRWHAWSVQWGPKVGSKSQACVCATSHCICIICRRPTVNEAMCVQH